jgi:hypothetical protein
MHNRLIHAVRRMKVPMPKIAACCQRMEELISREYPPVWVDIDDIPLAYFGELKLKIDFCPFCGKKIGIYY